jgi:hypothetical protein
MDLDAYRRSAESFNEELMREYYRHYAGLQDSFEIEAIYARHAGLFTRDSVQALRDLDARATADSDHTGESDHQRRARMLLDFAVEGYVGESTKAVEEQLARAEAEMTIEVGGERIGFREAPVVQANEADAARRVEIEAALLAATRERLGPHHRELIERQHACATELGWESYADMCAYCKRIDLQALSRQTAAFADASAQSYREVLDPELRRTLGTSLDELRRADLPRFFRAAEQDRHFPAARLTESFVETLIAHAKAQRLVYLRRYAGKLAYELELHGSNGGAPDWSALGRRYSELLSRMLQIEWPTETFLADVDEGFYCACYLRAWALETHLRSHLHDRFGPAWFDSAEAGEVLRGLWRDGQRLDAEELLEELTGERLDFGVVLTDLGLG